MAVGSELLTPLRSDSNALYLTGRLLEVGIEVVARATVADDARVLASAFRTALDRADVVLSTGGLGPTEDDLTREALAAALGRQLVRDPELLEGLKARFARFGRVMAPVNEKQADRIEGAVALANPKGSAPGQWVRTESSQVFLMPGPPDEMKAMFDAEVHPRLVREAGGSVVRTRVLRMAAVAESDIEQAVAPLYTTFTNPRTTILSAPGQVELHLVGSGPETEALARIEELATAIRGAIGERIYSEDGRELPEVVVGLLREGGLTVAVAESCTGGLLSARLTEVPGASEVVERGFITYSNRAKVEELGVPATLIEADGAVSETVARAMAEGARRAAGTAIGVGITGIAGPGGGTAEKPVGLVFIAIAGAAGDRVRRAHFPGARDRVRFQACQSAMEMLRRGLLGLTPL